MDFRMEHPNPQFERENWMNLNGEWRFEFDFGKSGLERKMYLADEETKKQYSRTIHVPFCPESKLSGVEYKDFMNAVWYQREFVLGQKKLQGRVLIYFGAVDYKAQIFINGEKAGEHIGGYSSFSFDITDYVREGENTVAVYAEDDVRSGVQPRGKQSGAYFSQGCDYTRTTGIWQTVWLEFVPKSYVKNIKYYPDIKKKCFYIDCDVEGQGTLEITAYYRGNVTEELCGSKTEKTCGSETEELCSIETEELCGSVTEKVCKGTNKIVLNVNELHLWECGNGRLYDLVIEYKGEDFCDKIKSYAGMREVQIDGYRFLLNGKSVFQRTVLDQGYYRDGIYTAPSDNDLLRDIQLSKEAGFNGARLHQKIFEPRFLYHCDREGYLVWGEHGNRGLDLSNPESFLHFMPEWLEAVERDFNHPSIIGWCPFNETWDYDGRKQNPLILENIYRMTKALDATRPCIDTSGNYHVKTDIYDLHNYRQNVEEFCKCYQNFSETQDFTEEHPDRQRYTKGLPLFISEYGGIKWDTMCENKDAWGYGEAPKTEEEFIARYKGLTECLLNQPYIMGFCYTQLYDVEQETNGLYDYDRNPKFDMKIFYEINSKRAAIEEES